MSFTLVWLRYSSQIRLGLIVLLCPIIGSLLPSLFLSYCNFLFLSYSWFWESELHRKAYWEVSPRLYSELSLQLLSVNNNSTDVISFWLTLPHPSFCTNEWICAHYFLFSLAESYHVADTPGLLGVCLFVFFPTHYDLETLCEILELFPILFQSCGVSPCVHVARLIRQPSYRWAFRSSPRDRRLNTFILTYFCVVEVDLRVNS